MSNERSDGSARSEQPTVSCSREELGIGANEIVFVNAAPTQHISVTAQEAWAQVLAAVPTSLLAVAPFAGRQAKEEDVSFFVGALEQVLAAHGVDDQRLIVFLRDLPTRADVRKYLELGTVYLDVHPSADSQGVDDALRVGVPPVCRQDGGPQAGSGAARLSELKLNDLIAETADEFVAKAQRLATDASWRAEVQKRVVDVIKAKPRFLDPEWYARKEGSAVDLVLGQDDGRPNPGAMDTHGNLKSGSSGSVCVSVDRTSEGGARTAQMTSTGPLVQAPFPVRPQSSILKPQASSDDSFWRGKKVMVYTDLPGIYGVGQYNHALLCELARRGAKAFCVQTKDDNLLVRERERLGVEHVWLSYHTRQEFERTFTDTKDPNKIFKKHKPGLIVFSNCSPRSNLAAKRVAMQRKIPFVIAESYVPAELLALPQWTKECVSQLATQYRAAKQVIAVSQDNLKLLRQQYGMPAEKGVVIHYGRPEAYFAPRDEAARKRLRAEFKIPEDAMLSFTAARMDPVKGYQYQLLALGKLKERDVWPKLYFAWAGAGPAGADVKEGVRLLGAAEHVRILGERNDVIDWLSAADCFVLTSKAEGMPICIMEAMAKGLPVAATAVSGTPEELGDTGCLLPNPNTTSADDVAVALVQALEGWARDPSRCRAAGERCRTRAEKMFHVERMLAETLTVLSEAFADSPLTSPRATPPPRPSRSSQDD